MRILEIKDGKTRVRKAGPELIDVKALTEDGAFSGYASKFGIKDRNEDIVQKGAFKKSLKTYKAKGIKMLWQHDPWQPIGFWTKMEEDDIGLYVEGQLLLDVQQAKEAHSFIKAGVIDAMSIGYITTKAKYEKDSRVRTILEADLREVSLVSFAALPSATISEVKEEPWTKRDIEQVLREAGMPNQMAVKLLSGGFEAADTVNGQRDADNGLQEIKKLLLNNIHQATKGNLK